MDKMMKECMKTHPLLHTLGGVGLGLVLVALVPALVAKAFVLGIILIVVQFAAEYMNMKK